MITNLSLNDKTQVMILEALKGTEEPSPLEYINETKWLPLLKLFHV